MKQEMKTTNGDRILAVMFLMFISFTAVMGILKISFSWASLPIFLFLGLLIFWGIKGKKDIKVGWKAQLLLFGERMNTFFGEGLHWVPWPFSLSIYDCREKIMEIDPAKVITKDNVEVTMKGTVRYRIADINKYSDIDPQEIQRGVDDARDQTLRVAAREKPLEDLLTMHKVLSDAMCEAVDEKAFTDWGIDVLEVVISEITPDPKVLEDMEKAKEEELKKKAQVVEADNFSQTVQALMKAPPDGPGIPMDKAIEQAQLFMGSTSKTIAVQDIKLDPNIIPLIQKIITGGK
jgi:regulator of protease activity HflC (stomatin/prohibitin superfamily)